MKKQRREAGSGKPSNGSGAQRSGMEILTVAFVLLLRMLQLLSRTASPGKRLLQRSAIVLVRRGAQVGMATNSLPGDCQPLNPGADCAKGSADGSAMRHRGWERAARFRSTLRKQGVRAAGIPESSPPLVRVSPALCLQPVVPAVKPGTERHHGQGDLYIQHAA